MANKRRGELTVRLSDGTEKKLLLDWEGMAQLDDEFGQNLMTFVSSADRMGAKAILTILWVGMKGAGSEFEKHDVAALLDTRQFKYYAKVVSDLLALALYGKTAEEVKKERDEAKKKKAGADPLPHTEEAEDSEKNPQNGTGTG